MADGVFLPVVAGPFAGEVVVYVVAGHVFMKRSIHMVGQIQELFLNVIAEVIKRFITTVRVDPVRADAVCFDLVEGQGDGSAVPCLQVDRTFCLGADCDDRDSAFFSDVAGSALHDTGRTFGAINCDPIDHIRIRFHVVDHFAQDDLAPTPAAENFEIVIFK